jgi:hypothetical protein
MLELAAGQKNASYHIHAFLNVLTRNGASKIFCHELGLYDVIQVRIPYI